MGPIGLKVSSFRGDGDFRIIDERLLVPAFVVS